MLGGGRSMVGGGRSMANVFGWGKLEKLFGEGTARKLLDGGGMTGTFISGGGCMVFGR